MVFYLLAGFDGFRKCVVASILIFEIVNKDPVFLRINNPVFTNTGSTVFEQFSVVVHPSASRGYNFNNPVRRTCAAFVCELVSTAYNAYIRLYIILLIICIEKYSEWSNIDLTGAALLFDVIVYNG